MSKIEILPDSAYVAQRAAELIVAQNQVALSQNNLFTIALSGGSTPKRLYELLGDPTKQFRSQLPWDRIHFFWSDERHVPPDNPDSNYRMVREALLAHVPVLPSNIHRIQSEKPDASQAADDYEKQLATFFNHELPRFDLVLLGLGTDGHTASLFPGSVALEETHRLVTAPWVEKLNTYRITMTLPILNNASTIIFLVSGEDKAEILGDVLQGEPNHFPAQRIKPTSGTLTWLVDAPAASKL